MKKVLFISLLSVSFTATAFADAPVNIVSGVYSCSGPSVEVCPLIDGRFNYLTTAPCHTVPGGNAEVKISEKGVELITSDISGIPNKKFLLSFEKQADGDFSVFKNEDKKTGGKMGISNSLLDGKSEGQIVLPRKSDTFFLSCTRTSSDLGSQLSSIGALNSSSAPGSSSAAVSARSAKVSPSQNIETLRDEVNSMAASTK